MHRLLMYLAILIIGAFIGARGISKKEFLGKLELIQNLCLLFLLLIMGIRIGIDKQVLSSFFELGYQALILSLCSIICSVLLVKIFKSYLEKSISKEKI